MNWENDKSGIATRFSIQSHKFEAFSRSFEGWKKKIRWLLVVFSGFIRNEMAKTNRDEQRSNRKVDILTWLDGEVANATFATTVYAREEKMKKHDEKIASDEDITLNRNYFRLFFPFFSVFFADALRVWQTTSEKIVISQTRNWKKKVIKSLAPFCHSLISRRHRHRPRRRCAFSSRFFLVLCFSVSDFSFSIDKKKMRIERKKRASASSLMSSNQRGV